MIEGTKQREDRRSPIRMAWYTAIPFVLAHLAGLGALWTGIKIQDVICCLLLFFVRMFGVTAGYHRYFSHKSFKTSRVVAFLLGLLAETSAQKGILWWAAHHRAHHRFSDTINDRHSPKQHGFWFAHAGWIYVKANDAVDYSKVADLARYPELVWLQRLWILPPVALASSVWLWLGWSGLWTGFFLSMVLLWHATFLINSAAHTFGRRRYATGDDSRNNLWLALITLGEGWHNNHHRFVGSARQGFFWWEIDITYYLLRLLACLNLVWDLRQPPLALKQRVHIIPTQPRHEPVCPSFSNEAK